MILGEFSNPLASLNTDLMAREYGGIQTTLLYDASSGDLEIQVFNGEDSFALYELERDKILDIFHHPFYYRAKVASRKFPDAPPADNFKTVQRVS